MRPAPRLAALTALAAVVGADQVAAVRLAEPAAGDGPVSEHAAGCDRAVGTFGRREVSIGTVGAVRAVLNYADRDAAEEFRDPESGGYGFKAPLAVRRGKVVRIAIARRDRGWAGIGIDGRGPVDRVRLTACPRPAPRRVPRYERPWSSWVNGFTLKRRGCVHLVARELGRRRIHRATLSFGKGDACAEKST